MKRFAQVLSVLALAGLTSVACARADEPVKAIPAAAVDETPAANSETAVFSGGCFWGVQGVFEHVKGVTRVTAGYTGGDKSTAQYETVSTGTTGHAESVQILYDPHQVTYGQLLRVYFSAAHDPTELNRQGPDNGTQYRSNIWTTNAEQQKVAKAYIAQMTAAKTFSSPIVTRVDAAKGFYPAEGYHQDFLIHNPNYPYIVFNDLPKVAALKRLYPQMYRDTPVMVTASR
ncbi:MAG TPA: peptide-methionine (S)-S-oxide reductase MsrA [Rhizomicrobium sp.]|jgi:peptide-methionine (S)-S-oxide reductase|nr:peptide-methionine (S)-S-oxide reductase MsrA [Rhizomicrobium sp.]